MTIEEQGDVAMSQDQLYCWNASKPGATLAKSTKGRLVLTDTHLIFLSSGKSDMAFRLMVGGNLFGTSTSSLDLSALENPGSFALPLERCTVKAAKKGLMSKYLHVAFVDDDGAAQEISLMTKNGGNWGQADWERTAARP